MATLHGDLDPEAPNPGGAEAQELFATLTADVVVDIPIVDFDDALFQIPTPTDIEIEALTEADLTSREVEGSGLFDGLMEAVSAHLAQEFEKGRITGAQYAEAYIASTANVMNAAVQYLLNRDQARWQAMLTQSQAEAARIAVVGARVAVEEAKVRYALAKTQAETGKADYALSKMKLATEAMNFDLAHVQAHQAEYQLEHLLPAQVAQLTYQTTQILPAQRLDLVAATSIKAAQESQVLYETASVLPAQVAKLVSERALSEYQLEEVLPAQVAGVTADTAGKSYTNDFLLPAQLQNTREQTESHRAKTLDTRSDGATVAGGMGIQKELYQQQITSYQRDAETKVAKMLIDTWITQKTMDEGLTPPTSIQDAAINSMLTGLRGNLDI
jgi:hypothetical protein